MNHASQTIATLDTRISHHHRRGGRQASWVRGNQIQRPVRAVAIVVIREDGQDPLKVLLVQNQQPVETLRANGAHKPLRDAVCLRRATRRANDLEPFASKHLVETRSGIEARSQIRGYTSALPRDAIPCWT